MPPASYAQGCSYDGRGHPALTISARHKKKKKKKKKL